MQKTIVALCLSCPPAISAHADLTTDCQDLRNALAVRDGAYTILEGVSGIPDEWADARARMMRFAGNAFSKTAKATNAAAERAALHAAGVAAEAIASADGVLSNYRRMVTEIESGEYDPRAVESALDSGNKVIGGYYELILAAACRGEGVE